MKYEESSHISQEIRVIANGCLIMYCKAIPSFDMGSSMYVMMAAVIARAFYLTEHSADHRGVRVAASLVVQESHTSTVRRNQHGL